MLKKLVSFLMVVGCFVTTYAQNDVRDISDTASKATTLSALHGSDELIIDQSVGRFTRASGSYPETFPQIFTPLVNAIGSGSFAKGATGGTGQTGSTGSTGADGAALSLGNVVISNDGVVANITNNGTAYTSSAISISGLTLTINSPIAVTSLTIETSGTNVVVNGDLLINGTITLDDVTSLVVNGDLFINGDLSLGIMAFIDVRGSITVFSGSINAASNSVVRASGDIIFNGNDVSGKNVVFQGAKLIAGLTFACSNYNATSLSAVSLNSVNNSVNIRANNIFIENNTTSDSFSAVNISNVLMNADYILCKDNSCSMSPGIFITPGSSFTASTLSFISNIGGFSGVTFLGTCTTDVLEFLYNKAISGSADGGVAFEIGTLTTDVLKLAQNCADGDQKFFSRFGTIQNKAATGGPYHVILYNNSCTNLNYPPPV